jgi:hypothetical protein
MSTGKIEIVNRTIDTVFTNTAENDMVICPSASTQSIHLGTVTNALSMLKVNPSNIEISGQIWANSNDSSNLPSYSWSNDGNTGMYHAANDVIGFSCGGSNVMFLSAFDSTTCQMSNNLRVVGSIFATSNITAFSDARFKTDIVRIDGALDKVMDIGGYTYRRVEGDATRFAGVMAQEVEKVLPEVVVTDSQGMLNVAYGNMVGLLVEAIKELNAKVNVLSASITSR